MFGKVRHQPDDGVKAAIQAAGGVRALGRHLGINYQAIQQWSRVPAGRVVEIERRVGVDRMYLRPDLFRLPDTEEV